MGSWEKMPGLAKDIAVDGYGGPWVIGTNPMPGGFGIFQWNGTIWQQVAGAGIRISAGSTPVVVNDNNDIFRFNGTRWDPLPGKAHDISAQRNYFGQPDDMCVIGTNVVGPGDFGVFQWNNTLSNWDALPGGGVSVSGGVASWLINSKHVIFSGGSSGWTQQPGLANDISASNGDIWVIGTNPMPGGFGIFNWSRSNWTPVDGAAVRIAVGADPETGNKTVCVVNDKGEIFRRV